VNDDPRRYFFDKAYDEEKNDQDNCDQIIEQLMTNVAEDKPVAVVQEFHEKDQPMKPIIINTKNVAVLRIETVGMQPRNPMLSKDCTVCLYRDVCLGRKNDTTIKDCCIPEAPLRKLQSKTSTAEQFISITNDYVKKLKAQSMYWTCQLNKV
jgi:hypothetical protein